MVCCDSGRPSSRARSWSAGTPIGSPTYRHEEFEPYQSGRVFEESLLEQLDLLLRARRRDGLREREGRPATRPTTSSAAAVAFEEQRGGEALVATSDRDMFQLASERTTILQPVRGVSELARIGPAEVRERYGVEPGAGARLHRAARRPVRQAARARAGIGPKKAADVLREYGIAGGRAGGRPLRGGGGGSTPLPSNCRPWTPLPRSLPSQTRRPRGRRRPPSCADWGLNSWPTGWRSWPRQPALRRRTSTSSATPRSRSCTRRSRTSRSRERLLVAAATPSRSSRAAPASREQVERCHAADVPRPARGARGADACSIPTPSPPRRATRRRCSRPAARWRRSTASGFALVRPPGHHALPGRAMGFCLSTTSPSPPATRRPSSGSSGWRSSTGTSTTATARRTSSGTTPRCSSSRCTSGRSTRAPAGPARRTRRR